MSAVFGGYGGDVPDSPAPSQPRERRPFFDPSRDLPSDHRVPFDVDIVYRDSRILIADKPHFLNTTPRGHHVTESLVTRLRQEHDLPDLIPAHRLDRVTAGLILCVINPEDRGRYQRLFADQQVTKTYEAISIHQPALVLPLTIRSRIVKERGSPVAQEVPGEPNAVTVVESLQVATGNQTTNRLAKYRLHPLTGRTHQLRIHMNSLGLSIIGDNFYPRILDTAMDDYSAPLQLLAKTLQFTDPFTGAQHTFGSGRELAAWCG